MKTTETTIAASSPLLLARTLYESFNSRELSRGEQLVAEDCEILNVPFEASFRGRRGWRQLAEGWLAVFPDGEIQIVEQHLAGDTVITEFIGRGTQRGPLVTPVGPIPPSGGCVEVRFCELMRFRDGKLVRYRSYFDAATMIRQLSQVS